MNPLLATSRAILTAPSTILRINLGNTRIYVSSNNACHSRYVRATLLSRQCTRQFISKIFGRSKKAPSPTATTANAEVKKGLQPKIPYKFPETLLVYYAGRRTVYIGCMKLFTIYPFLMTIFFVAPNISAYPIIADLPILNAYHDIAPIALSLFSMIPLGMFYLAAPYVTHIHMKLPPFARASNDMLIKYAKRLPEDAVVRIFTMRALGRPRFVEVPVKELRCVKKRLGCANWEWRRIGGEQDGKRMGQLIVRDFYVEERGGAKVDRPEVFQELVQKVRRQTQAVENGKVKVK